MATLDEILGVVRETQNDIKGLKSDMLLMKNSQDNVINKQDMLEKKVAEIDDRAKSLSDTERGKNVIIYNVHDSAEINKNLFNKIGELINEANVDINPICIADVYRIGKKKTQDDNRPVVVKFIAPRWKYLLFEKEQTFKNIGVQLSADLSKDRRILKSKLLKARYLLRQKGKNVEMRNDKLYLDKQVINMEKISEIIEYPELIETENLSGDFSYAKSQPSTAQKTQQDSQSQENDSPASKQSSPTVENKNYRKDVKDKQKFHSASSYKSQKLIPGQQQLNISTQAYKPYSIPAAARKNSSKQT